MLAFAIEQRVDAIAQTNPRGFGKLFVRQNFVWPVGVWPAPAAKNKRVQAGFAARRDRVDTRRNGFGDPGNIERCASRDAPLDHADARQPLYFLQHALRCALGRGENVGEAIAIIIRLPRCIQRAHHPQRHHHHPYARGNHQRDRESLAAHPPQVAQHLAVQWAEPDYHIMSPGRRRVGFGLLLASWPSAKRSTWSAISAITALCVIKSVVVPSSRLT